MFEVMGIMFGLSIVYHAFTAERPKRHKRKLDPVEEVIQEIEPGLSLVDQIDDTKIANDAFIDRAIDFCIAAGMSDKAARKLVEETHAKMIPGCTLRELIIKCVRNMNAKKRKTKKRSQHKATGLT